MPAGLLMTTSAVVFEDDVEVAGGPDARRAFRAPRAIDPDAHDIAGDEPPRRIGDGGLLVVDGNLAALDGGHRLAARAEPLWCGQELVEANTCVGVCRPSSSFCRCHRASIVHGLKPGCSVMCRDAAGSTKAVIAWAATAAGTRSITSASAL